MDNFKALTQEDLENIDGGLVVTGALVYAGFKVFAGGFALGYTIGQALKKK